MEDPKDEETARLDEVEERVRLLSGLLPCRYLKLNNGEDIIAQLVQSIEIPDMHLLRYPFRILADDEYGPSRFALIPLIPFTDQEIVPVAKQSVISIVGVRSDIQEIYAHRVTQYIEEVASMDSLFKSRMDTENDEDDEETDEDDVKHTAKGKAGWVN